MGKTMSDYPPLGSSVNIVNAGDLVELLFKERDMEVTNDQ